MAKFIRRILLLAIIVVALVFVFQWKNYQKKLECRDNALLYFKEQDYQKSIAYLEKALGDVSFMSRKLDQDMSCYLAESYQQIGEHDKAIQIYDALIEDNSEEKMYYLLKGDACQACDEMEQAITVYETGWKKTHETELLERICDAYMDSGDFETALKYAREGQEENRDDLAEFLFKEIVIYEKWEDYQKAFDAASRYVQQFPEEERGQKEYKFLTTRITQ